MVAEPGSSLRPRQRSARRLKDETARSWVAVSASRSGQTLGQRRRGLDRCAHAAVAEMRADMPGAVAALLRVQSRPRGVAVRIRHDPRLHCIETDPIDAHIWNIETDE